MEFPPIPETRFDIHGLEPLNKIPREKHKLTDKLCPFIVPNGAPFFGEANLVKMYDQRGGVMVLGRDYFFEGEFVPFCKVTGRRIVSFFSVSNAILAANDFVTVDYQSLGAYFVPRNALEDWVQQILTTQSTVSWENVFGKPDSYPACFHMHSIKTEISDWYELTFFYIYLERIIRSKEVSIADDFTVVVREVYDKLVETKQSRLALISAHDVNYSAPHGPTKADLLLGNHDNYATASRAEDIAGLRKDLLSTPRGVMEVAKTYDSDNSTAMLKGVIPISRFGGSSFIPPNISGSYEGLGCVSSATGICLENNGLVMFLSNHFDGRNQGLYYSYMENYKQTVPENKIIYTGFKYEPPSLVALGVNPTRIVAGSGNGVIMVGNEGSDWYLALTNGTFDPATHQYVKLDMAEILKVTGGTGFGTQSQRADVMLMDDWIILVYAPGGLPETCTFFRVKTADVRNKLPVKWEKMSITYTNMDGVLKTAVPNMQVMTLTRNAANEVVSLSPWTYRQPPTSLGKNGRSIFFNCKKSNDPDVFYFHYLTNQAAFYNVPPINVAVNSTAIMGFEFNPTTGVFKTISKPVPFDIGFSDTTQAQRDEYTNKYYQPFVSMASASGSNNAMVLATGEILSTYPKDGDVFPVCIQILKFKNVNTQEALLSKGMDSQTITIDRNHRVVPAIASPTGSGTYPGSLSWEADGELFAAQDPIGSGRKNYFRPVTGGYQVRQGVDNIVIPDVLSRPLTNMAYETNIDQLQSAVSITGSAAELTAGGVECGSTSLGCLTFASNITGWEPRLAAFRAPADNNVLMTFPRTHSKVLNAATRKAVYTADSFYGIRQNIKDMLFGYIPGGNSGGRAWAFELAVLHADMGGMFKGLNHIVASVRWIDPVTSTLRVQQILARPVIEAPNADHPGVHLITDLTLLHVPPHMLGLSNITATTGFTTNPSSWKGRGLLGLYRNGQVMQGYQMSAYCIGLNGTTGRSSCAFDINLQTNKLENIYMGRPGWNSVDFATPIPKVGLTDLNRVGTTTENSTVTQTSPLVFANTGGAAAIFKKTAVDGAITSYLTGSVYPATGWVIFFPANVQVIIEGSIYNMPGGTIDLRDIDITPTNKTFYIYAMVEDNLPKYLLSTIRLRKASKLLLAGELTTNDKQILTIKRYQPVMIGDFQLSYTREGGTIPISTGMPQDEGRLVILTQAELLP